MKTKLLYLASFMLVLFTACSVDENYELSDQEKELKLKNLVSIFDKEVRPSVGYSKYVQKLQVKSIGKSTHQELSQLEQEFLDQQSDEFRELYYLVSSLNLSEDEIRLVISEYFKLTNNKSVAEMKNDNSGCIIASTGGDTILDIFVKLFCEEERGTVED